MHMGTISLSPCDLLLWIHVCNFCLQCTVSLGLIVTSANCTYIVKKSLKHILWLIFKSSQELWRMFFFSYNIGYKTLNLLTLSTWIVSFSWSGHLILSNIIQYVQKMQTYADCFTYITVFNTRCMAMVTVAFRYILKSHTLVCT